MIERKEFKAKDGVRVYLCAIVSLLVLQFLFSFIFQTANLEAKSREYYILSYVASVCFQIGYLGVFVAYLGKKRTIPQIFIKPEIKPVFYVAAVIAPFLCFLFFFPASYAFDVFLDFIKYPSMDITAETIKQNGALANILMVFGSVFLAPVCEELIYRSALTSGLSRKFSSDFRGMLICACLGGLAFSLMHMSPRQTVFQFFLGFAATILALSSGSVIPAIILHFINNLYVVLTYFVKPLEAPFDLMKGTLLSTTAGQVLTSVLFAAAGVAVFIGLMIFLRRYSNKSGESIEAQTAGVQAAGAQVVQVADARAVGTQAADANAKIENKVFYSTLLLGLIPCLAMWISQLLISLGA